MEITQSNAPSRIQDEVCHPRPGCGRLGAGRRVRGLLGSILALWGVTGFQPAVGAEMSAGVREDGRAYWRMDARGFQLELVQLQPDQVRAFYIARGFSSKQTESLAGTCLMQMMVLNAQPPGAQPIRLPLTRWRITSSVAEQPLRLTGDWDTLWEAQGVAPAARLAFRWALFPVEQTFHPGDRNWGMITTGLPVGSQFDLAVRWTQGEQTETATLRSLRCAADNT